jgi:nucleotide-binding universal stress UspA family protein
MSKIICATDFSPAADQAAEIGVRLARAFGDAVELLHVVQRSSFLNPEMVGTALGPLRDAADKELATRVERLAAAGDVIRAEAVIGDTETIIGEEAAEPGTRLLVLGSHGRRGAARFFLGSVAERITRRAVCPVLVVPETVGRAWTADRPLVITAGVDLSPATDAALRWLGSLAPVIPCELNLVHLYWPAREQRRLGLPWPPDFNWEPEVVAVLDREVRARVERVLAGRPFRLRLSPTLGQELDPLVREAQDDDADLLVVGTRQRRASTAISSLRAASMPVLCVPAAVDSAEIAPLSLGPIRTVLVPTDFSQETSAAVAQACRLLSPAGGTLVLCHAVEAEGPALTAQTREQIQKQLLALIPPEAAAIRIRARTSIQESGPAAEAILHAARLFAPDAIVMSSHGRSGLSRAVLGSVAESVLRRSPVPVTVVRSGLA